MTRPLIFAANWKMHLTPAETRAFAAAFLKGWKPSAVGTHSYLFIDDIVTQSAAGAVAKWWPQLPVNGQVYVYPMSLTPVTNGGGNLAALKTALAAAPSVCMILDRADFHGATNGIYSNPGRRGRFWERDASLGIINTASTGELQQECGVRIRGNASRAATNSGWLRAGPGPPSTRSLLNSSDGLML